MIESLLLATTRVVTHFQQRSLTNASGFFFERDDRLFLVTSRHVVCDELKQHLPDRLQIELHVNAENIAECVAYDIPLYLDGVPAWRQGVDNAGDIDVAAVEIDRSAFPSTAVYKAFTPAHLPAYSKDRVEVGTSVLLVGFPLGFYDKLHRVPVARQAVIASSFGLRFQGEGYFLTDARTHRGTSGAPVVMRMSDPSSAHGDLPWKVLGVHSAKLDMSTRDTDLDEALGLNCAWYADILMALTER
ncbi:MAG: serine protease [Betaproteobacteria bacterium]